MTIKHLTNGAAGLGLAILAVGSHAHAADASDATSKGTLEEIVITAEKRSESIQDVPVSVTIVPIEELTRQGVQTITDLSRMSAALEFTAPATSPGGGGFIRGIGTEALGGDTATGSVSVVLDGVVLGNTNVTDIFDLNRVEILKGPQGTLFGASVSSGVISLTTNPPDPSKMSTSVQAEYGSGDLKSQYSRRSLRAMTNLPLTDTSAIRFSFHSDDNADIFHNVYSGQSSEDVDLGMRVRYLWNVSSDFTVNLIADYNKDTQSGAPELTYRGAPTGSALAISSAQCGVTPGRRNFDYCSQYDDRQVQLDRGLSAQFDWQVGGNTLTSISSYRLGDRGGRDDITELPLSIETANFASGTHCGFGPPYNCLPIYAILTGLPNQLGYVKRSLISEELRLASPQNNHFEWLAGIFYQHNRLQDDSPGFITIDFTQFGGGPVTNDTYAQVKVHTADYAAFGNFTYYLTDSTRLIAGARITHSTVSEDRYDPSVTGTQTLYSITTSATKPTFRVGLQENFAAHTMGYATISTGYKAPEIADNLGDPRGLYVVNAELPATAEIGVKQSVFDDLLAIDADIFYERVKDYQGQACFPSNVGISCAPSSVPVVNSKGIELDIFGRPMQGLTLNISGILNPATYPAGYLGSDGSDLSSKQLNYSSKTKLTFSGEQIIPLTGAFSFVFGADATYRSAQSMYLAAGPEFVVPANTVWNARLGLASSNNWSVYAFGRNIGAVSFPRQIYPTPFQTGGLWQAFDSNSLRVVGLQLQSKF